MKRSGWLGIIAFVALFDAWAVSREHPTLSADFANATKAHPFGMAALTAYMVTHLVGYFPKQVDPLILYVRVGGRVLVRVKDTRTRSQRSRDPLFAQYFGDLSRLRLRRMKDIEPYTSLQDREP